MYVTYAYNDIFTFSCILLLKSELDVLSEKQRYFFFD